MLTLVVKIRKVVDVPGGSTLGYQMVLEVQGVPGLSSREGPLDPTQDEALATLRGKLLLSHTVGSLIAYHGRFYTAVEEAVQAVSQSAPQWKGSSPAAKPAEGPASAPGERAAQASAGLKPSKESGSRCTSPSSSGWDCRRTSPGRRRRRRVTPAPSAAARVAS
jgi:hypothetical protein